MKGADLGSILTRAARKFGDRQSVVLEDRSLTYAELEERATKLADALRQRGLDRRRVRPCRSVVHTQRHCQLRVVALPPQR